MKYMIMSVTMLMMLNAMFFYLMSSPILVLLSILLQTFMLSCLMKTLLHTSWFSMILFLVFVGGLMVMFMYVTSLASNNLDTDKQMLTSTSTTLLIIITLTSTLLFWLNDKTILLAQTNLLPSIFKIYSSSQAPLIITMMFYLLLVLLVTVSIVMLKSGPLRSNTN
uniref:NADH dehydrogenase subunit 6 n=1 Tax=Anurida maritima TaxID=64695 RepID=UPI0022FD3D8B|nr:NADH dehydrogenase subunit 6 [Anurida maritima]WBK17673.1 NADH dehydrogenase subunit 6 [Anurida maritima]